MRSIFVYNPESGKGKVKKYKDYILQEFSKKFGEIDCVETAHAGEATELAKAAVGVYDYFFISGGDGTINEVINGFKEAKNAPVLGIIPSGTVNDVANSLGLSKNIKKSVKNIINSEIFEHDIFKVNDRYGIYVCCAGLFSQTSYDTDRYKKKHFGKLAYFFRGVNELSTTKPTHVKLITENETIEQDCAMMLIFNSRSTAGFKINKKAKLDDGLVELVLFHSHKKRIWFIEILRTVNLFLFGINFIKKKKNITYRQLNNFSVELDDSIVINLDGEKSGTGSFEFTVINKGVKILTPKNAKKRKINEKSIKNRKY